MAAAKLRRTVCAAGACSLGLLAPPTLPLEAKAPGVTHCYRDVCHRVRTVEQTRRLVGRTMIVETSFYDFPGLDRFNTGMFTSNGERFDAGDPARVASADLPDGTELLVRNPANGRVSHVRVNDFGPFRGNRRLDVTRRVAEDLDFRHKGVVKLEVTVISPPHAEDLRYRRNRPPRATTGHLGVVFDSEVPELISRLVAQRAPPDMPTLVANAATLADTGEPIAVSVSLGSVPASAPASPAADPAHDLPDVVIFAGADAAFLEEAIAVVDLGRSIAGGKDASGAGAEAHLRSTLSPAGAAAHLLHSAGSSVVVTSQPLLEKVVETVAQQDAPDAAGALLSDRLAAAAIDGSAGVTWSSGLSRSGAVQDISYIATVSTALGAASIGIAGVSSMIAAGPAQVLPTTQPMLVIVFLLMASALLVYAARTPRASARRRSALSRVDVPTDPKRESTIAGIARDAAAAMQASPVSARAPSTSGTVVAEPALQPPAPPVSVIGSDMMIEGTVKASGRLIVSGIIRGRVEAGELVLTRGGAIDGEIFARCVEIAGVHRGSIVAETLSILAGGSCTGDVTASTISVELESTVEASFSRPRL